MYIILFALTLHGANVPKDNYPTENPKGINGPSEGRK